MTDEAVAAKERQEQRAFELARELVEVRAAKNRAEAERDEVLKYADDIEKRCSIAGAQLGMAQAEVARLTAALAGARAEERERCIAAIEALEPTYWMQERAPLTDDDGTVIMELKPRKMGRLPGLNDAIAAIRALEPAKIANG